MKSGTDDESRYSSDHSMLAVCVSMSSPTATMEVATGLVVAGSGCDGTIDGAGGSIN